MKATPLEKRLTGLVAPVVESRGCRLVCVKVTGNEAGGGQTIQIMAENPETRTLGVEDCAKISREVSALFDVEDPIKSAYRLEVSSPGLERPLVSLDDFAAFAGHEAKVEIDPPVNEQKKFRGRLRGVQDDNILMTTNDQGDVTLPFASVEKAKLVITDDMFQKGQKKSSTTHKGLKEKQR